MFIIQINYIKPIEIIDQLLTEHRTFLDEQYQKNNLIASGPQNPRTGGIIISQLKSREKLDALIKHDPFFIHGVAEYSIIEFTPIKFHPNFSYFINN